MDKIKAVIVGWGNVGRFVKRSIEESSDMELVGVLRRLSSMGKSVPELEGISVVSDTDELPPFDVAIVTVPSREAPDKVKELLEKGYSCVDSFDVHDQIYATKEALTKIAQDSKAVSIFGAGWDPGSDSAVRVLMRMTCPLGMTTTTFGGRKGGRSMGHTAAVKAIPGVENAVALTLPNGPGKHKRQVYIELKEGVDFEKIADQIRHDPYFIADPTDVVAVEDISPFDTLNHGGRIERATNDVVARYEIEGINPYMTANVLVSAARAAYRACQKGDFGAYTLIERPLIDYLPGSLEERLKGY